MKNYKKGFIVPLVIIIIVLVVGGGIYFFYSKSFTHLVAPSSEKSRVVKGGPLSILSPTYSDTLEPNTNFTVVFSPVQGASKYEITISEPLLMKPVEPYRGGGLVSPDQHKILLQATTTNTSFAIKVPNSQYPYSTATSYEGGVLMVRAVNSSGEQIIVATTTSVYGKEMSIERPAIVTQQIKILPLPNNPELLDADKYSLEKEGGVITLKFGALSAPYTSREVLLMCYFEKGDVTIDEITCPDGRFTAGATAFTKKIIVKPNINRNIDTSFAIRVRNYDAMGKGDDYGLHDSWVSIKIRK